MYLKTKQKKLGKQQASSYGRNQLAKSISSPLLYVRVFILFLLHTISLLTNECKSMSSFVKQNKKKLTIWNFVDVRYPLQNIFMQNYFARSLFLSHTHFITLLSRISIWIAEVNLFWSKREILFLNNEIKRVKWNKRNDKNP